MNWKVISVVIGVLAGLPAVVSGWSILIKFAVDFEALSSMITTYQDPQTMPAWEWLMETYTEDRLGEIENRLDALEGQ